LAGRAGNFCGTSCSRESWRAIPLIVTFDVLKIAYGVINDISAPFLKKVGWISRGLVSR